LRSPPPVTKLSCTARKTSSSAFRPRSFTTCHELQKGRKGTCR
jgi:hypothetical protein